MNDGTLEQNKSKLEFPHPSVVDSQELRQLISGVLIPQDQFEEALSRALLWGVSVDNYLIQNGLINETTYIQMLAQAIGIDFLGQDQANLLAPSWQDRIQLNAPHVITCPLNGNKGIAVAPRGLGPSALKLYVQHLQKNLINTGTASSGQIFLTTKGLIRQSFLVKHQDKLTHQAREGLAMQSPRECAKGGLFGWQYLALIAVLSGGFYGLMTCPWIVILWGSFFFAVFFFLLISLRLGSCLFLTKYGADLVGTAELTVPPDLMKPDKDLPIYTVLVPLFHEAHIVPQLINALLALDYPLAKLDIKLLLEEVDFETIAKVRALTLPPCFDILIVPNSQPRTKPKALNYGLQLAKGEFVVIFDAEDIPQPDQLKRALSLFAHSDDRLASMQAKLNFYNSQQNWLTKQFCVEYCSLFDGLLPSFSAFGFPLPLGGTSNHFRTSILINVGGWDPYNVTEDADLGMRLYRRGFVSKMLPSTTYEEACSGFKDWIMQRTRWLKGWMQTYIVHMRHPFALLKDLGLWKFLGFQAIIGGPIFAALAHPIFLGVLVWEMPFYLGVFDIPMLVLWGLSFFNLLIGYLATMWLGAITLRFRSLGGFLLSILTIPFYWILISLAAYRAVFQLIYAPFYWEKTHHKGRSG